MKEKIAVYKSYCYYKKHSAGYPSESRPAFRLNDTRHDFFVSMATLLELVQIGVANSDLPKLPLTWCTPVSHEYSNFCTDETFSRIISLEKDKVSVDE